MNRGLSNLRFSADRVLERTGNFLLLACCDPVEKRECERAGGNLLCDGQRGRLGAGMTTPRRLQMDRGKVAPRCNALAGKRGLNAVAVNVARQADNVNKPADRAIGESKRRSFEPWNRSEQRVISFGGGLAQRKHFANAGKLRAAQSAGQ